MVSSKVCKKEGCRNPPFSRGFCKYHRGYAPPRKTSKKQTAINQKKTSVKAKLRAANSNRCFFDGRPASDLVHLLRQGTQPLLRDETAYAVLGCRDCHTIFDDGTWEEIENLPNIEWALEIMEAADPQYRYRFEEFKKLKTK